MDKVNWNLIGWNYNNNSGVTARVASYNDGLSPCIKIVEGNGQNLTAAMEAAVYKLEREGYKYSSLA